MKTLAPQRLRPTYWRNMEKQVVRLLYDIIFKPIVAIVNDEVGRRIFTVMNSVSPLLIALRVGRVQYANGAFTGQFSAAISSELKGLGATFDARRKAWMLGSFYVPAAIKAEALTYQAKAREMHKQIKEHLSEIQANLDKIVAEKRLDAMPTVDAVEDGFKAAAQKLQVNPQLNDASKKTIAETYTENMKLKIRGYSAEQILTLREVVEKNATEGYRSDKLIDGIKRRYYITTRHAKFLARNETSIFMSKYHQERYGEAGITHYIWSTSHDARVRPTAKVAAQPGLSKFDNHRRLDGRTFAFANPPIVDTATGRKANPGEDYNCRCVAIPVLSPTAEGREQERKDYRELVAATDYSEVRS